ncbi:MAG: hypothetical protein ABIJ23_01795 [Candidatus Magasanikbacteria bacterium]
MLEQLFGSKTRFNLLRVLFRQTDKPFFVRELSRLIGTQINAVRRELELLLKLGLVKEIDVEGVSKSIQGSTLRKYYILDKESLLYPELQALLLKAQLLGEQKFIKEISDKAGDISLFLLTGRFTGREGMTSDMLIVGKIKERTLAKIISDYEKDFGFEIMYTIMTDQEFKDRRHVMDKFLYSLFEADNLKVINKLGV